MIPIIELVFEHFDLLILIVANLFLAGHIIHIISEKTANRKDKGVEK